jgi:hypothetical protein
MLHGSTQPTGNGGRCLECHALDPSPCLSIRGVLVSACPRVRHAGRSDPASSARYSSPSGASNVAGTPVRL